MSVGPFLWRELITSVRRGTAFSDRRRAVVLMTAVVAGWVVVWDRWGWDRASVAGAASFALTTFGLIVAAQAFLAPGLVPVPVLASERDRKSLDSLLATPLSATEIVLGTMGAGLLRYANGMAALAPVLTLMVFLGGIDPRLVLLAVAGLASTAFVWAALSAFVSAGARTASRAMSSIGVLAMTWMGLPILIVCFLPRVWPAAGPWVIPVALRVLDSSPLGVGMNLVGAFPRGPLVGAVLRMIALQLALAMVFVLCAIARLRPASRAVYDVEGRNAWLRGIRAARRQPLPRPACGDDPVLWNEMYPYGASSRTARIVRRLESLVVVGLVAWGTSWFAVPAFSELVERGYGAFPEAFTIPEPNSFTRVIVGKMIIPSSVGPAPGQARLEFNIALRVIAALLSFSYVIRILVAGGESIERERQRDTWLGLLATPLSGWEILRAKMLGAVWRVRGTAFLLAGLWAIGLLAGAVHPLGFLAALAWLAVTGGLCGSVGVSMQLGRPGREGLGFLLSMPVRLLGGAAFWLLVLMAPAVIVWASLFSYEDVHAAIHAGRFPQFSPTPLYALVGSRTVLAAWLIGTTAQALAAFLLTRSAVRGFDVSIGRPIRTRGDARPA